MTRAGILPLRKPGTVTCWLIFLYAASRLGLSSSKGTSTVSRTRVGFRVSTALFTVGSPWGLYGDGGDTLGADRARGIGRRRPILPVPQTSRTGSYRTSQDGTELLVGVAGFEPTAFRSQSGRATKLRHTPLVRHVEYMSPYAWAARIAPAT